MHHLLNWFILAQIWNCNGHCLPVVLGLFLPGILSDTVRTKSLGRIPAPCNPHPPRTQTGLALLMTNQYSFASEKSAVADACMRGVAAPLQKVKKAAHIENKLCHRRHHYASSDLKYEPVPRTFCAPYSLGGSMLVVSSTTRHQFNYLY